LGALVVFYEFGLYGGGCFALLFGLFYGGQEELDGMASADRVLGLVQIVGKVRETLGLDPVHALHVKLLDRFMDHRLVRELVSKAEPRAPVTKVRRNDKNRLLIKKVGQEDFRILGVLVFWNVTHHQRNNLELFSSIFECFLDERKVQLQTVLILLKAGLDFDNFRMALVMSFTDSTDRFLVYRDVAKGGLPLITRCSSYKVQEDLMGGAHKDYSIILGSTLLQVFIGPASVRPAIAESSMWADHGFQLGAFWLSDISSL
jgi:hypothetical protein